MPSAIITELNRSFFAFMSPAEVAAGTAFLAINIDLAGGKVALIEGFEYSTRVAAADRPNLTTPQVQAFRDLSLVEGVDLAVQIGSSPFFLINSTNPETGQITIHREYPNPIRMENASKYTIVGQALFAVAPGAGFVSTFAVYGRLVQQGEKTFPLGLR